MNNLIWKYGHLYAPCNCEKVHKFVNFTTLCPYTNPITADDYKEYHKNIDIVANKLKCLGFKFIMGVMIGSHSDIDKNTIERILQQKVIE